MQCLQDVGKTFPIRRRTVDRLDKSTLFFPAGGTKKLYGNRWFSHLFLVQALSAIMGRKAKVVKDTWAANREVQWTWEFWPPHPNTYKSFLAKWCWNFVTTPQYLQELSENGVKTLSTYWKKKGGFWEAVLPFCLQKLAAQFWHGVARLLSFCEASLAWQCLEKLRERPLNNNSVWHGRPDRLEDCSEGRPSKFFSLSLLAASRKDLSRVFGKRKEKPRKIFRKVGPKLDKLFKKLAPHCNACKT